MLSCVHGIVFKKYLKVLTIKDRNACIDKFPRNFDKIFAKMFDEFLNIPDCQSIPNIEKDWIPYFVNLFKSELGNSFMKFRTYLKELNATPLRAIKKKNK